MRPKSSTKRRKSYLEKKERLEPLKLSRKRRPAFLVTRRAREVGSEAEATVVAVATVVASGSRGPMTKDSPSLRMRTTTRITILPGDSAAHSAEAAEASEVATSLERVVTNLTAASSADAAAEAVAVARDPGLRKSTGARER